MKGLFKQWNKRNLNPIGKITVVKSLILPVLSHLFIALPNPSIEIIGVRPIIRQSDSPTNALFL